MVGCDGDINRRGTLTNTLCGHHARHLGGWPHSAEGLGPSWGLGPHGAWHILEVCRQGKNLTFKT